MLFLQAAQQGGSGWSMIIMLVMLFAIMYFFMFKPQRKRQKEIEKMRNELSVGDKVITASGVYGIVKDLNMGETYMTIEISKGVLIKVDRNSIYADSSQIRQQ